MASYTSSQSGNWSSAITWGGSGPPGNGDTATIGTAAHVITLDTDVTGLAGLSITGTLTWSTLAHKMNLAGNLSLLSNGIMTWGPGGILEFDNSGRTWTTTPAFSGVGTLVQTSGTTSSSRFICRTAAGGTNVQASTTDSHWFTGWTISHVDFLRMGDSTHDGIDISYGGGTAGGKLVTMIDCTFTACGIVKTMQAPPASSGWSFMNCTWSGSVGTNSLIVTGAVSPTNTRLIDQCVFDAPVGLVGNGSTYTRNYFGDGFGYGSATADWAQFGEATPGDGYGNFVRAIVNNGAATLSGGMSGNYVFSDTPNAPAVNSTATAAANVTSATGSLTDSTQSWTTNEYQAGGSGIVGWCVYITGGTGVGQARSIVSNTATVLTVLYPWKVIPDATSTYSILKHQANQHCMIMSSAVGPTVTFTGNVAENGGCDNNGNLFSGEYNNAGVIGGWVIQYNLLLPSASLDNPFDICALDSATVVGKVSCNHNTVAVGGQPLMDVSDSGNTPAGAVTSWKNNIAFCDPTLTSVYVLITSGSTTPSAAGPYYMADDFNVPPSGGTSNIVSPTNADYNGSYGLKAVTSGGSNGFQINLSAPVNTHGVTGNPSFVDSTRKLSTWAVARGYSTSTSRIQQNADAMTALQAAPGTRISDLITWVKAGFAPTNAAYHNAASDGTDIGAVPGVFGFPTLTLLGVG